MYQEYWDNEWLGADDIWQKRADNGEIFFNMDDYNMAKYGRQCEKEEEPEPVCYPWY